MTEFSFLIPALPYLIAMKDELIAATIKRALAHMKNNELTPQMAYNLWLEVWAADGVITRLEKRVKLPVMAKTEVKTNG